MPRIRRLLAALTPLFALALALPACTPHGPALQLPQAPGEKVPAADASLDQFLDLRAAFRGELAPDGSLYFTRRAETANQLYRQTDGRPPTQLTDFPDGIMGYSLSPDGRHILISAGVGGDEQGDLYLMPAAGGSPAPLFVDRKIAYGGVEWRRDSRAFAYRANDVNPRDFYIYVYDLDTRTPRCVLRQDGSNTPVDWTRDGSKLLVGRMNSASYQQLFEIDLATGKSRELTPPGVERQFSAVGYTADETHVVVNTDYLGNFSNIALLDVQTAEITPLLPEFARFDADSAALSDDRTLLAVVINDDGYGKLHLRRMADRSRIPAPRLPDGLVGGLRFTDNTLCFSVANSQTPGNICSWDVASPTSAPSVHTIPEDAGIDLQTCVLPKLIRYKSFDGMQIPAFLYLPRDYSSGRPIPFIISFHGGPEGQSRPSLNVTNQYFISRGFGVLDPNVRGSSGYGTEYMNMDNYKNRMVSVRDGVAAAQYLIDKGYATREMIGVHGGSYGGFMVMAVITEAPDLFAAACNYVGIVNFKTFLENTKDYRRHLREAEYGPLSDPAFLDEISPIHKVDRIQCPLLVVHGQNDPRVPVGEAEQIAAALRQRNHPVELLVFPDEGHGVAKQPNRIKLMETVTDFFQRHLKGNEM